MVFFIYKEVHMSQLNVEDKYLPDLVVRKMVLQDQIGESKKIIYRNYLDWVEGMDRNQENMIAESEFNIKQLKKKIDLTENELEKLGQ